jgi:putative oxidoreductase
MNKKVLFARLLLGSTMSIFGLNGFFHFIPMPPLLGNAGQFMAGLGASGYFFPFLKATEICCGILLIIGKRIPLALLILAPILLNIILFHLFLSPEGLILPLILTALELYLAYNYRKSFEKVLKN